jgi:hypothetical protein
MENALIAPAKYFFLFIPTVVFSILIPLAGVAVFTYIMAIRMAPLVKAAPDSRFDRIPQRIYKRGEDLAGPVPPAALHAGRRGAHRDLRRVFNPEHPFLLPGDHRCLPEGFVMPGFDGVVGHIYNFLKDYAATAVLVACAIAAWRRAWSSRHATPFRPNTARTTRPRPCSCWG